MVVRSVVEGRVTVDLANVVIRIAVEGRVTVDHASVVLIRIVVKSHVTVDRAEVKRFGCYATVERVLCDLIPDPYPVLVIYCPFHFTAPKLCCCYHQFVPFGCRSIIVSRIQYRVTVDRASVIRTAVESRVAVDRATIVVIRTSVEGSHPGAPAYHKGKSVRPRSPYRVVIEYCRKNRRGAGRATDRSNFGVDNRVIACTGDTVRPTSRRGPLPIRSRERTFYRVPRRDGRENERKYRDE